MPNAEALDRSIDVWFETRRDEPRTFWAQKLRQCQNRKGMNAEATAASCQSRTQPRPRAMPQMVVPAPPRVLAQSHFMHAWFTACRNSCTGDDGDDCDLGDASANLCTPRAPKRLRHIEPASMASERCASARSSERPSPAYCSRNIFICFVTSASGARLRFLIVIASGDVEGLEL